MLLADSVRNIYSNPVVESLIVKYNIIIIKVMLCDFGYVNTS